MTTYRDSWAALELEEVKSDLILTFSEVNNTSNTLNQEVDIHLNTTRIWAECLRSLVKREGMTYTLTYQAWGNRCFRDNHLEEEGLAVWVVRDSVAWEVQDSVQDLILVALLCD